MLFKTEILKTGLLKPELLKTEILKPELLKPALLKSAWQGRIATVAVLRLTRVDAFSIFCGGCHGLSQVLRLPDFDCCW